jgi:histidinol-phosphatase (PHP family)
MIDLHIHTNISPDGKEPIENYVHIATQRGLKIIGFTEHWDFDRWDENAEFTVHTRSEAVCRAYKGPIEVLFGAELAYHPQYKSQVEKYMDEVCPDYVLGSIHEVEGYMITELEETGQYFEKYGKKGFGMFFDAVGRFAQDGLFDVLGHLDVIKRFSVLYEFPFVLERYKDAIKDILKVLIKREKGMEINTSGLRQAPGSPYPGLQVVKWFFDLGGKYLTIGSDSHDSETVGFGSDTVISKLQQMGIIDFTIYRKRVPISLNII